MCGVWQTSNLRRLRLGEEKKIERKKKPQGKNIMFASAMQGGHNKSIHSPIKRNVQHKMNVKKLKPRLVYDIRPGNRVGLFWFRCFINMSLTYLLKYVLTAPDPHGAIRKVITTQHNVKCMINSRR